MKGYILFRAKGLGRDPYAGYAFRVCKALLHRVCVFTETLLYDQDTMEGQFLNGIKIQLSSSWTGAQLAGVVEHSD